MPAPKKKPLMRSLGEFFGHLAKAVKTDPAADAPARRTVRHDVEEQRQHTPDGTVVLRRTTIEEVEVRRDTPAAPRAPHGPGQ